MLGSVRDIWTGSAAVPQKHESLRQNLLPTQRTLRLRTQRLSVGPVHQNQLDSWSGPDLGVAPLGDALPAEDVSTGGAGGVPPGLQAQDAASGGGVGGHRAPRTRSTERGFK